VLADGVDVTAKEPGERDVAMVFQSYALYPHMTVAENIGFPLKMIGTPRDEIERSVRDAADKVRIGHLLERRPGQLSGGQQQRCALARAIVRKPRLFLLDEPLSNLDAKLRLETRVELRKLQRSLGVTAVYVTHDQEEAMTIADRIAIFMEGRIVPTGTPEEIFARPATATVASDAPRGADGPVVCGVRPGALRLAGDGIPAQVYLVEDLGDSAIVDLTIGDRIVKMRVASAGALAEGDAIRVAFDAGAVHLFDPATGARR
jgi:multiple sugar transport system ATP-binding protein